MAKTGTFSPTLCAPRYLPVKLLSGSILLQENQEVPLFSGQILANGWGQPGILVVSETEELPMPVGVQAEWYSFADDLFFALEREFDPAIAQSLFELGTGPHPEGDQGDYDLIIAGFAPGGWCNLWWSGAGLTKKIVSFQAEPVMLPYSVLSDVSHKAREDYRQENLLRHAAPEPLKLLLRKVTDFTAYRALLEANYELQVHCLSPAFVHSMRVMSTSGEVLFSKQSELTITSGWPETIYLLWSLLDGQKLLSQIQLAHEAFWDAIQTLRRYSGTEGLCLEIRLYPSTLQTQVILRNMRHEVEIKPHSSQTFRHEK